jgi:PPP family 3-phenylpropionic acid transporter
VIALIWCSAAVVAAFPFVSGFPALLALSIAFGATLSPCVFLADDLTLRVLGGLRYARVRVFGSLSFLVVAVAAGDWVEGGSPQRVQTLVLALSIAAGVVAFGLPSAGESARPMARPSPHPLKDRSFLALVVAAGLIQGSHAAYYSFSTLTWRDAGIRPDVTGRLWAEGVLIEVLLFAMGGALVARLGSRRLLLLAAAGATLRWVGTAATTNLAALVLLQMLHAASFAATHLGAVQWVSRRVPAERAASALGLLTLSNGLVLGAATWLSGRLVEVSSARAFGAMALLSLAGAAVAFRLPRSGPPRVSQAARSA